MEPAMTKKTKSRITTKISRCLHRFPNGKRCRLALSDQSSSYCHRHAHLAEPDELQLDFSRELAPDIKKFTTAVNINKFLATLLQLLAQDRITPRRGAVLAYTCNLLLRTLPAIEHELYPDPKHDNTPFIWDIPGPDRERDDYVEPPREPKLNPNPQQQ
jgi:hypothetical protein